MSCEFCAGKFMKKKLGRCKQCMWLNFLLLVLSISLYGYLDVAQLQAVQRVALFMLIAGSAILMSLHAVFWCVYQFRREGS